MNLFPIGFILWPEGGLGSIVAEIYRPASEFLPAPPFRQQYEEILAATRQAGIELITRGKGYQGDAGSYSAGFNG